MAETPSLKRQRDETQIVLLGEEEETKKHKTSYNDILSLLDEEEEEPNQDLSSLITSLQEELSSDPLLQPTSISEPNESNPSLVTADVSTSSSSSYEDEEDKERVIRHLLEASDDELGIPQSDEVIRFDEEDEADRYGFGSYDVGLWEFEDETANYYTLLQSELFM